MHANNHFVKCEDLVSVFARAAHRDQTESVRQLVKQARGVLAQEQLAATTLPAQVVYEVDVADEIGFFETDDVPVLVCAHAGDPVEV